ncbi:tRNA-modifying protein YgfZ [Orbus mooreae]|uniref:tRNA-modifying protein YgfZ n=1 Tax=Orbus mooreae TaxID=3074107 RepID=UPI00370D3CFC
MLYTSQSLPSSKISLDNWLLVKVSGQDNSKFLQGQLTADINKLSDTHWLFAAQCDPKGKVLSNILLFKRGDDIYYIIRKSLVETQLKELKKYAVFSKISFEIESSLTMVGIAGDNLSELIPEFSIEQNCLTVGNISYLKLDFPTNRYIVIAPIDEQINQFTTLHQADSEQWQLLDMESNYPIIDQPLANQYLPQAFNLQNFNAISFDKGCYCGQEMVARAQYRGINKRALYLLIGSSDELPQIGDGIEQQMGENWRETGSILSTLKIDNHTIWIQVILNNDIEANTVFRVKNSPTSHFIIKSN